MKTHSRALVVTVIRWLARALAVCVLLFWGGFFVEHAQEWFIRPFPQHPPLKVCVGMAVHFALLVGLVLALRWARVGSSLVIVAAFLFLIDKAGSRFPLLFGVTVFPAVLLLLCDWHNPRNAARSQTPPPASPGSQRNRE